MSRRNILRPFKTVDAASMAGDVTSATTNVDQLDFVAFDVSWSGTSPVGEIFVDGRNGSDLPWQTVSFGVSVAVSGNSGSHRLQLEEEGFSEVRLRYVRTSGTGTLDAWISGETEGA